VDAKGNITTFYAGLGPEVLPTLYGDGKGLALGNIMDTSLEQMAGSEKLQRMMEDFDRSRRACEASCEYFAVCTGGFELTQKQTFDSFEALETTECMIHVKTLVDALMDDIDEHLERDAA
jgi:uncharacterized protein